MEINKNNKMITSKVKIVRCTSVFKECWYKNLIGEEFEVVRDNYKYLDGSKKYLIVNDLGTDSIRCIDDKDVILVY